MGDAAPDVRDLLDRVADEAGRRATDGLDGETSEKLDLLIAARRRLVSDPDWSAPADEVLRGLSGEVLSRLAALPVKTDWRVLPPAGAAPADRMAAPSASRGGASLADRSAPIGGHGGPRGASGALAWLLGLAVLTVSAMSIWL